MRANPVPTILAAFGGLLFAACTSNAPVAPPAPLAPSPSSAPMGWTLQWSDEFEGVGLPDPLRWDHEEGLIRNQEAQYYTRNRLENARLEGGSLVLEARKERFGPSEYTSASLVTKGRAHFLYGRVEVRARLPRGRGLWPAIWMLGANIGEVGWPLCGEIDVMENVGFEPNRIHANIHVGAYNHAEGTGRGAHVDVPGVHDEFHLYALEWFPDHLDVFVNGRKYFTFAKESSDVRVWPFDRPHYLILNVAVGGTWGGAQGIDDTVFPQRLLVDYVRVFSRS